MKCKSNRVFKALGIEKDWGTRFEPVEIDALTADFEQASDRADAVDGPIVVGPPVSQRGDLWQLGKNRLMCGDARDTADLDMLMQGDCAHMAFLDPPNSVAVKGIVGRGSHFIISRSHIGFGPKRAIWRRSPASLIVW